MKRAHRNLAAGLTALVLVLCVLRSDAIGFGQQDTFQDGTVMGWQEGGSSPNPPTNIPTGGPGGTADAYLENISAGGAGAGAKMTMFNLDQWTGNYRAAQVDRITVQMANFGATTLHMRVGIRGSDGITVFASTNPAILPPDGIWRSVDFDLDSSSLTSVGGPGTIEQVLDNIVEVRLVSAIGGPAFMGDPIAATLGVDNIVGHDIAQRVLHITQLSFVGSAPRVPRIRFTTIAGGNLSVQRKNSLSDASWVPLPNGFIAGNGREMEVDDLEPGAASQPKRMYRVVLLPPI